MELQVMIATPCLFIMLSRTVFVQAFGGRLVHSCKLHPLTYSLIFLIPRVMGTSNIKKCRPASLANCSYKILSKQLANRLWEVFSSMVSFDSLPLSKFAPSEDLGAQTAETLTSKRLSVNQCYYTLILKRPLLIFRWISSNKWYKQKGSLIIVWLGFYPCSIYLVPHYFLIACRTQFQEEWNKIIHFLPSDMFDTLIRRSVASVWLKPVAIAPLWKIANIQFANDTLVLCGAESAQALSLILLLTGLKACSGLPINCIKSLAFDFGNDHFRLKYLTNIIGCQWASLLFSIKAYLYLPLVSKKNYLGITKSTRKLPKSAWLQLTEKIQEDFLLGKVTPNLLKVIQSSS